MTIAELGLNAAGRPRSRLRVIRWFREDEQPELDEYPYRFALPA